MHESNSVSESIVVHTVLTYLARLGPHCDPRLCQSVGIRPDQIARLHEMSASAVMDLAVLGAGCVKVEIDAEAFGDLITDVDERKRREALIHAYILHDASRPMMTFFFDMSPREYARLRSCFGVELTTGRPRELTPEEADAVLGAWQAHGGDADPKTLLGVAKDLDLPLRLIFEELRQHYSSDEGGLSLAVGEKLAPAKRLERG